MKFVFLRTINVPLSSLEQRFEAGCTALHVRQTPIVPIIGLMDAVRSSLCCGLPHNHSCSSHYCIRFHDLVFGHELGSGSFSVVKYARHITKGKPRSQWPEFAVKVISTTKIQVEHNLVLNIPSG